MTATLSLSPDQAESADKIERWVRRGIGELSFGGLAGTGKTTMLGHLYELLRANNAAFVAPSGKAAYILRTKGISATTVHSLIYLFTGTYENFSGDEVPIFEGREDWGGDIKYTPEMLVVEESSMINEAMCSDLRARGLPILWVGDHGQLAPVGGDPGIMQNPNVKLERIHRQAANSPILRLAHKVRQGGKPSKDDSDGERLKVGTISSDAKVADYALKHNIDQIVCAFNSTRHAINKLMRQRLGYVEPLAVRDRVICRFNNRRHLTFNGQLFTVTNISDEVTDRYTCDLVGEFGEQRYNVPVQKISLGNPEYKTSERTSGCCDFDYGYAITGHASQGSQWSRVLVMDQPCRAWSMDRWRYTAITRASDFLTVALR